MLHKVPFTSVYAGQYRTEDKLKINALHKLTTTQKKQTTQNTAKPNCPGSVASYDTRPGKNMGLLNNALKPTRGIFRSRLCTLWALGVTFSRAPLSLPSFLAFLFPPFLSPFSPLPFLFLSLEISPLITAASFHLVFINLSAVLACSPSVTGLFRTPLLVFGTVCSNTSPPHPLWPSSSPMLRLICSPSCITPFIWYSARAITFVALHTIIAQCYYTV